MGEEHLKRLRSKPPVEEGGEVSGARMAATVEVEGRGPCWPRARALVCSDSP